MESKRLVAGGGGGGGLSPFNKELITRIHRIKFVQYQSSSRLFNTGIAPSNCYPNGHPNRKKKRKVFRFPGNFIIKETVDDSSLESKWNFEKKNKLNSWPPPFLTSVAVCGEILLSFSSVKSIALHLSVEQHIVLHFANRHFTAYGISFSTGQFFLGCLC